MISLTFDTTSQTAKLDSAATIVAGADVPITLSFSSAPGAVSSVQLALGTPTGAPKTLAYTESFESENETTWDALLDASDTRLATFVQNQNQPSVSVTLELIVTIDGERIVCPHLSVAVQSPVIQGPDTSEGGPTYLTEAVADGRYISFVHFLLFGDAVLNAAFGQFKTVAAVKILAAEISAQDAPTGSQLTVTLVDGAGTSLGQTVSLADGVANSRAIFGSAIALAADGIVKGKVTAIGSTTPGGWLTLRLTVQQNS